MVAFLFIILFIYDNRLFDLYHLKLLSNYKRRYWKTWLLLSKELLLLDLNKAIEYYMIWDWIYIRYFFCYKAQSFVINKMTYS